MKQTVAAACVVSALVALILAQGRQVVPDRLPKRLESRNFIVAWDPQVVNDSVAETARQRAEAAFDMLSRYLGDENTPRQAKIAILLEGDSPSPDGRYRYPHVDSVGRIHLFRFGGITESYFGPIPHELVHVFRRMIRGNPTWNPFLEEALASYVADQVVPASKSFPLYGFPLELVAAQWLHHEEFIPLSTLMTRHRQLNLPCKLQTYTLRASFFTYLHDEYGKEAVLRLAYHSEAHSEDLYRRIFREDLKQLEKSWMKSLRRSFETIDQASAKAKSYRTETPVKYMKICKPGVDF